jgi:phage FluMu protein Com
LREKPSGPPCVVCHEPITDFSDLLKCKCGQLYHEKCAEVARQCTKCGNALVEIIPEGPVKNDVKCPTCGQMNSVEEGTELILVQCGKCGVILEKVADGYNYLVVDNDHTTAFKMFVALLKNGCTGLSISTTFPDKLKKEHDMETAEVIWLTDTTVADKKTINPHRLEFEMMRMYAAFVKSNPKSAIILDGFEYLVVENGFDKVFKFIKKINDLSSVNNATLIVPIGTSSLEPDQLGTLKKEFDKVIDMVGNGDDKS